MAKTKPVHALLTILGLLVVVFSVQKYKTYKFKPAPQSNTAVENQSSQPASTQANQATQPLDETCAQLAAEDLKFAKDLCTQKSDYLKDFCSQVESGSLTKMSNDEECGGGIGFEYSTICDNNRLFFVTLSLSEVDNVPESINPLTKLLSLKIFGIPVSNIPSISNKHIESLDLFSDLKDQDIKPFETWLGNLTNIKTLELNLTNNFKSYLPEVITKLPNLNQLTIGDWNSKVNLMVPNWLSKLTNLQVLEIRNGGFGQNKNILENLSKLEHLTFSKLNDSTLPKINKNLSNLSIQDGEITSIPEWIGELQKLRSLTISNTKIKTLPETLGKLTQLVELSIISNRNGLDHLPESFGNLINLKSLDLSNTFFKELPNGIGNLGELQKLYLFDEDFPELPESFSKLKNHLTIYFGSDDISYFPEKTKKILEGFQIDPDANPSGDPCY